MAGGREEGVGGVRTGLEGGADEARACRTLRVARARACGARARSLRRAHVSKSLMSSAEVSCSEYSRAICTITCRFARMLVRIMWCMHSRPCSAESVPMYLGRARRGSRGRQAQQQGRRAEAEAEAGRVAEEEEAEGEEEAEKGAEVA